MTRGEGEEEGGGGGFTIHLPAIFDAGKKEALKPKPTISYIVPRRADCRRAVGSESF